LSEVVDGDDVRVRKAGKETRLAVEALGEGRVAAERLGQDLEGIRSVRLCALA